jgi:nucleolar GTP-binding protein
MNLLILPKSAEILDTAFRRARKQALMLKSQRNRIKDAKGKNIRRIEVSANYVSKMLQKAVVDFPSMKKVNPFYKELIESTVDLDATLKALGHITAERKIITRLKARHIGRVKGLNKKEAGKAPEIAKEFYGRLSGLVKKLDSSIEKYNQAARKLKELPSIKFGLPTAIIAGCPNTGKSTLLGRLTKSKPKIASYPFTTQKLQIGYLTAGYEKIQLIDTPGLLDRPFAKRNKAERKGIAALRHLAKAIVFVVDPTMQSGFSLEKQASLLAEIRKEFKEAKTVIVVNKADIANREEMKNAKKAFGKAVIEGKGLKSGLKGEIAKKLKQFL